MPINPIPQPVDVIINPSGEPPKIKDFIINAPLIVQSTNVKNKLDTITKETDNLSTRLSALEISSNASDSFFFSNSPNTIETSGSLYLSGAIKSSYISSSTGAYITGSVTQGYSGNIASGINSHAEGRQTRAQGIGSHAEGSGSIAWGIYSFAAGNRTIASGSVDVTQAAFGRFNKRDNTTSLFVIGNGTGDSNALRKDIFRAESTGELVLSGGIRHSFLNNVNNTTLMNLNYHMWVFDTFQNGGDISVTLPIINDNVVDIGLTVVIKQHDSDGSGRIVTIRPTTGKTILGFNTEFTAGPGMVLTTLGGTKPAYTRRSITLTYTGLNIASGNYRWTVMATSEC